MPQSLLRDVVIVQPDVALNRRLQRGSAIEAVGGKHFADAAVEPFDPAVRKTNGRVDIKIPRNRQGPDK